MHAVFILRLSEYVAEMQVQQTCCYLIPPQKSIACEKNWMDDIVGIAKNGTKALPPVISNSTNGKGRPKIEKENYFSVQLLEYC